VPVSAAIDWGSLTLLPGSQVDRRLRRQHCDLLFSVRIQDKPAILYLLLEHKSRSDRFTALQLLGYVVGIWKAMRRRQPRLRWLPPVLPIVIHHGRRGWTAATELAGLVDVTGLAPEVAAEVMPLQPRFRFLLDSSVRRTEAELRGLALSWLGKLTLAALQFVAKRDPVDVTAAIVRWADVARSVLRAPSGHEAFAAITSYILLTTTLEPEDFGTVVEQHVGTEAKSIMRSTGARLRAEGKAEGATEGRAAILLRQIRARFGPQPEAVEQRVRSAGTADLELWADRILTARTLAEVFGQSA
jgi:hypothetical protein